jgi:hypothetical protein
MSGFKYHSSRTKFFLATAPFRVKGYSKNLGKLLSKEHKMFLSDFAAYLKPQQNWHCPNISDIQSAFASDMKDAI